MGFLPSITFEVAPGWSAAQSTRGFFDIQDDPGSLDVVAVQFANIPGAATADAAATSVESRPNLVVGEREQITLGGMPGIRVEVETADPLDTQPPVFRDVIVAAPGALAIASARRLQLNLLDTPQGVVAVLLGGSIADWDRALELGEPVLDSIAIGGA
jgi:hypothetical protein